MNESGSPDPSSAERTVVKAQRARSLGMGGFLTLIALGGVQRAVSSHDATALVLVAVFLGLPGAYWISVGLRRRAVLVIDAFGFTDCGSGRTVPWTSVATIRVSARQGMFDEYHELKLELVDSSPAAPRPFIMTNATNPAEIEVSLDGLSMSRQEVVAAVERNFGQRVLRG